jgi:DNA-directed RNA polymerase specialized sigma24 family protein
MARRPNPDNPLVAWRHALRGLRRGGRLAEDPRDAALRRSIEVALLRVPPRQREVLRRYDLSGEPAIEVQRGLGISTRQFFRDRRAALTELAAHLPNLTAPRPAVPAAPTLPPRPMTDGPRLASTLAKHAA